MEQPPQRPLQDWLDSIVRQVRHMSRTRYYGSLRIEVLNGKISRCLLEQSIKEPEQMGKGRCNATERSEEMGTR